MNTIKLALIAIACGCCIGLGFVVDHAIQPKPDKVVIERTVIQDLL